MTGLWLLLCVLFLAALVRLGQRLVGAGHVIERSRADDLLPTDDLMDVVDAVQGPLFTDAEIEMLRETARRDAEGARR